VHHRIDVLTEVARVMADVNVGAERSKLLQVLAVGAVR
jgi:hypothetical protein